MMRALGAIATSVMLLGPSLAIAGQDAHTPDPDAPVDAPASAQPDPRTQYPEFLINSSIAARTSIYGEGGLGITSRHGFPVGALHPVVRDAHYASLLAGGGIERTLSPTWDLTAGALYSPGDASVAESRALMISGGFRYTMR